MTFNTFLRELLPIKRQNAENLNPIYKINNATFNQESILVLQSFLQKNPHITHLHLENVNISSDVSPLLGEILKSNTTLTHLTLRNNNHNVRTDKRGKLESHVIEGLKDNTTLTHLDIPASHLTQESVSALGKLLLSNATITQVDLTNTLNPYLDMSCLQTAVSDRKHDITILLPRQIANKDALQKSTTIFSYGQSITELSILTNKGDEEIIAQIKHFCKKHQNIQEIDFNQTFAAPDKVTPELLCMISEIIKGHHIPDYVAPESWNIDEDGGELLGVIVE